MNEIQTGSNQAVQPLPKRTPGASFVQYGRPGLPPLPRGQHRKPESFGLVRHATAVLVLCLIALASCGTPAPAAPKAAPSPVVFDWTAPKVTPAAQRRIEVVDRITPSAWNVGAAAEWLDRYTASNMVLVSRCSGKAYRCITVRGGKLSGNLVGWAKGNTITIDTVKVARSPYRSATYRKRLLAHELAHTFGLDHAGSRNLMATTVDRMRLSLTAGQRAHLRAR